jgi:hypothetical protein
MDNYIRFKIVSQIISIVIGLIFLLIFFLYKFVLIDNSMADVFFGAFIGTFGIAIVNIISVFITHKAEIDFQNENTEKVIEKMVNYIEFDPGDFNKVIKKALESEKYINIDILANTSQKFIETLKENDFSCVNNIRVLLQNKEIRKNNPIYREWETFYNNNREKIKQISFHRSNNTMTEKMLYGMILHNGHGIMGFYNPQGNLLNVFGLNKNIRGHSELLNVIDSWFSYYINNSETVRVIPGDNKDDT